MDDKARDELHAIKERYERYLEIQVTEGFGPSFFCAAGACADDVPKLVAMIEGLIASENRWRILYQRERDRHV